MIGDYVAALEAAADSTITVDLSSSTGITTTAHHNALATAITGLSLNAATVLHIIAGTTAADLTAAAPFSYATINGYAANINAVADTSSLHA